MNLFQMLITADQLCNDKLVQTIISVVKSVLTIIQFGVPAILIILCAVDMFKAMIGSDEKAIKAAQKTAIKRLIYALVIFLIVPILSLIMSAISKVINIDGDDYNAFNAFMACWGYSGGSGTTNNNSAACKCYQSDSTGAYYWVGDMSESECRSQSGRTCIN